MENDVLSYLKMNTRDEVVTFMKQLWSEQETREIYRLIIILDDLNER